MRGVRPGVPAAALAGAAPDAPQYPAADVLVCVQGGVSTTEGDSVRGLWFTAGFLLGVVTTALGLLWMMAMAVVA